MRRCTLWLLVCASPAACAAAERPARFIMNGRAVNVQIPPAEDTDAGRDVTAAEAAAERSPQSPSEAAPRLAAWLNEAGAQLDRIELLPTADGTLRVVAAQDLPQGVNLLRLPFARRFGGEQLPAGVRRALRRLQPADLPSEAAREYLKARRADCEVALGALVERRRQGSFRHWVNSLPPPGKLRSGLSFTQAERECLPTDARAQADALVVSAEAFRAVAAAACRTEPLQAVCGEKGFTEEETAWATALTTQRARRVRWGPSGEEDLVLFPVVDLMGSTADGQVVPAGLFYDKDTRETTAATFTTTRPVKKGETLALAPQTGLMLLQSIGLFGVLDAEFPAWPLQLTWSRLSESAKGFLSKQQCGEEATALVLYNGTYSSELLRCLRVAAAFQTLGDAAAELDFDGEDSVPRKVRLGAFDFLAALVEDAEKKVPSGDSCKGASPDSVLGQIAALNQRVLQTMANVDEVMGTAADEIVQEMTEDEQRSVGGAAAAGAQRGAGGEL
eukprot:TRINITY_DN14075_c0_g1_i1.p1 TRINITY_DN14075_c0_g1~~TRINITY_DN14075_c0_g1_i1.p1  ORF type:complete len:533 (+),score=176.43 TRINITY_DN14075_c0_g1_i1:90-1601(+)